MILPSFAKAVAFLLSFCPCFCFCFVFAFAVALLFPLVRFCLLSVFVVFADDLAFLLLFVQS